MAADKYFIRSILAILVIVAASALTVAALILRLTIADPFGGKPHPTDAEMLEQFAKAQPALEELVAMIGHDPDIQRLAPDFIRPDPAPISPERLADYRQRLQRAGVAHGFSHYGDTIEFIVSTRGLAVSGSGKSFVYSAAPDPDATVVEVDLDAIVDALTDKDVLLQRKIDGDWWLQLDMR